MWCYRLGPFAILAQQIAKRIQVSFSLDGVFSPVMVLVPFTAAAEASA
jgi:hypothetical protein